MHKMIQIRNAAEHIRREGARARIMAAIKRIPGYVGTALGTVGMLLCVAVIVCSWWVNGALKHALLFRVIPPIETAFGFGETIVSEFNGFVADARIQLSESTDTEAVISALEDAIRNVQVYVDVATAAATFSEQIVTDLVDPSSGVGAFLVAERLLGALHEVTETLASVRTLTQQIDHGTSEQIDVLDAHLDTLQTQAVEMELAIADASEELASIKRRIPLWINVGSLLVTLIFCWFGAAQFALLRVCWQFVRRGG